MTLGDVFGLVSKVSIRSILRFWSYLAAGVIILAIVLCILVVVISFFTFTVQMLGWPIILLILFLVGGLVAGLWTHDVEEENYVEAAYNRIHRE